MNFSSQIRVMLLALVAAFAVGCGDSEQNFVITGNPNNRAPAPTTGNLVFGFTQAQSAPVPSGTQILEFEFFDDQGDAVFTSEAAFAATVTIANVPVTAVEVEITARGAGGVPLALISDATPVVGGTTSTVDLSNALITPITLQSVSVSPNPVALDIDDGPTSAQLAVVGTFSNGDLVALDGETEAVLTFNGTDNAIATVSAAGLVGATGAGATSVDISAAINGASVTLNDVPINVGGVNETLGTLIVRPEQLVFDNGGLLGVLGGLGPNTNLNSLGTFRAYFLPPGETDPEAAFEVTQDVGVSFGNFFPDTVGPDSFTYLYLEGQGLAVGTSPLGPVPAFGTTGTMTVTYIDTSSPTNQVYTNDVDLLIDTPELAAVIVAPEGDLTLPNAVANFPVGLAAVYTNGAVISSTPGTPNALGDTFLLDVETNAFLTTDGSTLSTAFTEGTTTVDVLANGDTNPMTSFQVTVTNAVVVEVALTPNVITLNPVGNYRVIMTFSDGATMDVTRIWEEVGYSSTDGSDLTVGSPLFGDEFGRLLGREAGVGQFTIGTLIEVNTFMNTGLGFPPGNEDAQAENNTSAVVIERIITGIPPILFP